jgi:hypothetical protein
MRILIKVLSGTVWSMFFFIGTALVGALVSSVLSELLTSINLFNPSSINSFTKIFTGFILFSGPIAGFYIGYSRALKKDTQDIDNKQLVGKLVLLSVVILIIGFIGYIIYANMRAYNKYGYYVYVSDETVFGSKIDPGNPKIINHERMLKIEIVRLDEDIDSGDGQKMGKVRWYGCRGIDCDEGWESVYYK